MRKLLAVLSLSLCVSAAAQTGNVPVVLVGPSQVEGAAVTMHPSGLLLGGWRGGTWQADRDVKTPWPARWQAFTLGQGVRQTSLGASKAEGDGPCAETLFTTMKPTLKARRVGEFQVLVPTAVKAQLRPVTVLANNNAVYSAIVQKELVKLGFRNPPVKINSVVRVDLDGNGTQEVLIEASNIGLQHFYPAGPSEKGGQYSVVLLRYVRSGQVFTTVLAKDIQVKAVTQAEIDARGASVMTRFGIAGVLDVNGDGRMEVVLAAAYYEGLSASVLEFTPSWKAAVVAESGCGA